MADLVYTAITSLDGYIEDEAGEFDWSAPDEEVHQFVNDNERGIGTYLLGRKMYEVMQVWETIGVETVAPPVEADFASVWRAADKVVYSTTLAEPVTSKTRIEQRFDPDAVRRLKSEAASPISVSGPELAAHAFRAGLVDVCHLYVNPVIVGGGKSALPDGVRLDLELLDQHRFSNGVIYLAYRVRSRS